MKVGVTGLWKFAKALRGGRRLQKWMLHTLQSTYMHLYHVSKIGSQDSCWKLDVTQLSKNKTVWWDIAKMNAAHLAMQQKLRITWNSDWMSPSFLVNVKSSHKLLTFNKHWERTNSVDLTFSPKVDIPRFVRFANNAKSTWKIGNTKYIWKNWRKYIYIYLDTENVKWTIYIVKSKKLHNIQLFTFKKSNVKSDHKLLLHWYIHWSLTKGLTQTIKDAEKDQQF